MNIHLNRKTISLCSLEMSLKQQNVHEKIYQIEFLSQYFYKLKEPPTVVDFYNYSYSIA